MAVSLRRLTMQIRWVLPAQVRILLTAAFVIRADTCCIKRLDQRQSIKWNKLNIYKYDYQMDVIWSLSYLLIHLEYICKPIGIQIIYFAYKTNCHLYVRCYDITTSSHGRVVKASDYANQVGSTCAGSNPADCGLCYPC